MTFMVHVEASPSAKTAGADSYTYRSGNHPGKYGPLTILMSWKHWIEDHPRADIKIWLEIMWVNFLKTSDASDIFEVLSV